MRIEQHQVGGLIDEGIQHYFFQPTLSYATIRHDLLKKTPVQAIIDHLSDRLNADETQDKLTILNALLKSTYQSQLVFDKKQAVWDAQESEQDQARGYQLPSEIDQIDNKRSENSSLIASHNDALSAYQRQSMEAQRNISLLRNQCGQVERSISTLQRELATIPSAPPPVIVQGPSRDRQPPPVEILGGGGRGHAPPFVRESRVRQNPPPVVVIDNGARDRLQSQIESLESERYRLRQRMNALDSQVSQMNAYIRTEENSLSSLQSENGRLLQHQRLLSHELDVTLPAKEKARFMRVQERQDRSRARGVCQADIDKSIYSPDKVMATLSVSNQQLFHADLSQQHEDVHALKRGLNCEIHDALYVEFLNQTPLQVNQKPISHSEQEALKHIAKALQDHLAGIERAVIADNELADLKHTQIEMQRTLTQHESRLKYLVEQSPGLNENIGAKTQDNTQRQRVLIDKKGKRKRWGIASSVLLGVALICASPLIIYASGYIALSALTVVLLEAAVGLFSAGFGIGLIATLVHHAKGRREEKAIEGNSQEIDRLTQLISSGEREMKTLTEITLPTTKKEITKIEKSIEAKDNELGTYQRQASDYYKKAETISPSSLRSAETNDPLPSAPPWPITESKTREEKSPEGPPPAYSP